MGSMSVGDTPLHGPSGNSPNKVTTVNFWCGLHTAMMHDLSFCTKVLSGLALVG